MQDVNYAEALWQKLVYPSDNIKLVICGHECHITDYAQQVSFRTEKQFQYVLSLPYLPFLQRPANMHGVNNPLISLI